MAAQPVEDPAVDVDKVAVVEYCSPHTGRTVALTEREHGVLEFERLLWRYVGAKEQAIKDRLGLSAVRYYQILNVLIDDERATAWNPILVQRLAAGRARRYFDRR